MKSTEQTNRIDRAFQRVKDEGGMALIPFLTIGDPDVETSVEIILGMEQAGADIVELGVPYSDPLADGPVIQSSSMRALQNRVTLADCIRTAGTCRERGSGLPFIIFTYYNPVLQMGLERFFDRLLASDVSGIIIPDLPIEENAPVRRLAERHGIHLIPLVAPTSNERVAKIAADAAGFVYCVSSLGVTGTRTSFYSGIDEFLRLVRRSTDLPIAVGFGISNRSQVEEFAPKCDGVVVGSAIVRTIEGTLPLLASPETRERGLLQIHDFVRQLKL